MSEAEQATTTTSPDSVASTVSSGALTAEERQRAIAAWRTARESGDTAENAAQSAPQEQAEHPTDSTSQESGEPELTEEQKIRLRVREEEQRIRAAALRLKAEQEAKLRELEAREQKFKAEMEAFQAKMKEFEERQNRLRGDPEMALSELGTSLDDLVRAKLEAGKPEARITQLERQIEEQTKRFNEFLKSLEDKEAQSKKAREEEEHRRALEVAKRQQEESEKSFIELAQKNPDKYPIMSKIAQKTPWAAIALGYAVHFKFQQEQGRIGEQEELLATLENALREEAESQERGAKRKTAVSPKAPASVGLSKPIEEMTYAEARQAAIKELARMRAERKTT
jgi:hypothetical protein